ncbi:hypothetical protein DIPPA_10100 [Diplonema papillatum]|nr:hypothetical protein DIPPA_10100 [Diplonema papillatum]
MADFHILSARCHGSSHLSLLNCEVRNEHLYPRTPIQGILLKKDLRANCSSLVVTELDRDSLEAFVDDELKKCSSLGDDAVCYEEFALLILKLAQL